MRFCNAAVVCHQRSQMWSVHGVSFMYEARRDCPLPKNHTTPQPRQKTRYMTCRQEKIGAFKQNCPNISLNTSPPTEPLRNYCGNNIGRTARIGVVATRIVRAHGDFQRPSCPRSKSNVTMNAWLPQASYPCGNFSDTSSWTFLRPKGSIGHVFTVCIRTENQNQASFSPCGPHKISVLIELTLGHLRYFLTDVPPQPNSPPDVVFHTGQMTRRSSLKAKTRT